MRKFLLTKVLVVFLTLCGISWSASAQGEDFNKGDMVINAGVGLGTYINHDNDAFNFSMTIPPISASFEYGVADLFDGQGGIGVGGYMGYILFKGKDKVAERNNFNVGDFFIGPRGLFHYQFVDKLDTYAGLMLGYDIVSFSQENATKGSQFSSAFFIGARYYVTHNFGVFGELGYGISPLQLGLTYKF